MGTELEDLWPELDATGMVTPKSILMVQASALNRKTRGLVNGDVPTWSDGANIFHRLDIVVPGLDDYRYSLLCVHHSAILYPVYVDDGPEVFSSEDGIDRRAGYGMGAYILDTEEDFRLWLGKVLSAEQTKAILESLLAQVRH